MLFANVHLNFGSNERLCWKHTVGLFSITAWLSPSAQSVHKDRIGWVWWVWNAQSPGLNPITHFWMNWNENYKPNLLIQHQCLTSLMLYWMNGQKFSQKQKSVRCYTVAAKEGLCINVYVFRIRCHQSPCSGFPILLSIFLSNLTHIHTVLT